MFQNNWAIVFSLSLALVLMLVLNYFFSWWLMPDLLMVVLLQWLLQERVGRIWWVVLPLSLLLDLAGQTLLGFHAMIYALMAICVLPLASFWARASVLEQFMLVILLSVGYVVLRTLATYMLTDIPAPVGWYWPIFTQILSWPVLVIMREAMVKHSMSHKRS